VSANELHDLAQEDTPSAVSVPREWRGLLVWAVGRFGSGILFAVACAWALQRVYDDHAAQTRQLMTILEQRARVDLEMTQAVSQLRSSIDDIADEARAAHRGVK